jgi:hypothetical protein
VKMFMMKLFLSLCFFGEPRENVVIFLFYFIYFFIVSQEVDSVR